jgi:hypothetical protein
MRWALLVGGLSTAVLAPSVSHAEFYSGNEVKRFLETQEALEARGTGSPLDSAFGLGFTAGVWDAYQDAGFCPPPNVTLGQAAAIALKHLRANPERLHRPGKSLLLEAFSKAFPCKK